MWNTKAVKSGWTYDFDAPNARFYLPNDQQLHPDRWEKFLRFHRGQLHELCVNYKPDLLWFDGDWERHHSQWRMAELREQLHEWSPTVVLNSRIGTHGDYETPEQGIPIEPPNGVWEFCMTMNDSWGYRPHDTNQKSVRQLIRYFADTISGGGRLLLNIGPRADGRIDPAQAERLRGLGAWIRRYSEAIHGSQAGLPPGHFNGASTLSSDGKTLYLICYDRPLDQLALRGLCSQVERVTFLDDGQELTYQKIGGAVFADIPGILWIDLPNEMLDRNNCDQAFVVAIHLAEPLRLYRGKGKVIDQN